MSLTEKCMQQRISLINLKAAQSQDWINTVRREFMKHWALCFPITNKETPFHLLGAYNGRAFAIFCHEDPAYPEILADTLQELGKTYTVLTAIAWKGEEGAVIYDLCFAPILENWLFLREEKSQKARLSEKQPK